jgi:hypothetical protein
MCPRGGFAQRGHAREVAAWFCGPLRELCTPANTSARPPTEQQSRFQWIRAGVVTSRLDYAPDRPTMASNFGTTVLSLTRKRQPPFSHVLAVVFQLVALTARGSRTIASRRLISGGNDDRHCIRSREASNKLIKLSSLINCAADIRGVFLYSRFGGFHKDIVRTQGRWPPAERGAALRRRSALWSSTAGTRSRRPELEPR